MRSSDGRVVLIVEDEQITALDLVDSLEADGCRPIPVDNITDGKRIISTGERIDIAILDINIDGSKVYPIADMLKDRGVPFIFMTGQTEVVPTRFCSVPVCLKPMKASAIVAEALAFEVFAQSPDDR